MNPRQTVYLMDKMSLSCLGSMPPHHPTGLNLLCHNHPLLFFFLNVNPNFKFLSWSQSDSFLFTRLFLNCKNYPFLSHFLCNPYSASFNLATTVRQTESMRKFLYPHLWWWKPSKYMLTAPGCQVNAFPLFLIFSG